MVNELFLALFTRVDSVRTNPKTYLVPLALLYTRAATTTYNKIRIK